MYSLRQYLKHLHEERADGAVLGRGSCPRVQISSSHIPKWKNQTHIVKHIPFLQEKSGHSLCLFDLLVRLPEAVKCMKNRVEEGWLHTSSDTFKNMYRLLR
jgi:hypothetical protein